ncbi:hypothetical protein ACFLYP_04060 [Chloroflexota bacterium]
MLEIKFFIDLLPANPDLKKIIDDIQYFSPHHIPLPHCATILHVVILLITKAYLKLREW